MKLLLCNDCFTVTLNPIGRLSFVCPALYQYETIRCTENFVTGTKREVILVYSEKINLEVTLRFSFQARPPFLGKDKLAKCT